MSFVLNLYNNGEMFRSTYFVIGVVLPIRVIDIYFYIYLSLNFNEISPAVRGESVTDKQSYF